MKLALTTYRYGSERLAGEGLRIGAARHVPRGIRREDWRRKNYFDFWMPLLAPDAELVRRYRGGEIAFAVFERHYRAEMKKRGSLQVVELLAGIASFLPISVGCFCEDEAHCHRSILRRLISDAALEGKVAFGEISVPDGLAEISRFASPVCYANDDA
jgi:uncharacterized protein YeaO (DUF488 family)